MITHKRLMEVLNYDKNTGVFIWKKATSLRTRKGNVAGYKCPKRGYLHIGIDGRVYLAHRLAWLYVHGYLPENGIDHINRNKMDNRIANLREASQQCNARNSKVLDTNTSGIQGVYYDKHNKKWRAFININNNCTQLGRFDNIVDAAFCRFAVEQCIGWQRCDKSSSAYIYLLKCGYFK